ncbi:putative Adhesion G protein-coupled receptor L4 [Hypsibius exemplaris]|uniref:Adhesion G protein-coupled receptor L4 n=1 Tax=Hypsibius exemplaris TaxID=2072580 RepID=A0A1W0XA60_HYPEX|nr:putative Adhesion G protein-coupled receptor L4 [Hypsibius exemplaris]
MFPTGSVIFVVVATIGTVRSQSCLWFADEQLKNIPGLHRISDQDVALRNVPWGYVCCNVAASVYTAAIQDNNYWSVSQDSCNSGTGVPQGLWPAPVMGDLTPVLGLSVKRQTPTPEYPEMVCPEESGYVPCLISLTGDVRQYLENYRQPCRYNPVITVYCHTYISVSSTRSDYAYARTANDSGGFVDKDDSPKWDLSENLWIYVSELSSAGTLVVSPECGQLIVFDSDTWGTERWTVSLKVTQSGTSLPIVELASDLTVYPTAEPLFDTQGFITNEAEAMHTRVALRLIQKIPYSSCVTMSPRPCLFDNVVTATNPTGTASSIIVSVLIFDENDLPPAFQPLNSGNTILLEHGDPNQASQLPSVRAIDGDSGILCPIRYTMDSGGDIFAVHPSDGRITFASGITHLAWNATTESNVYNLTVRAAEDNSTYTPNPDYTPTIQACRVEMFDLLTITVQVRARAVVPTTTALTSMSYTNTMGQATSPATSAIPATSIAPNTSTSATNSTALTDGCPAETKRYPNGELFHWRPVSAGQVHVVELGRPLEYCPDPYFRRICVGNPVVGFSSILPTDPCPMSPEPISPIVALLASNLTAFPPDPSSREMLATSVAQAISSPINILTVTELNYLAIFLQLNTEDVTVIQQNLFYLLVNIIGQLNSGTAITQLQTAQNYSGSSNTIYSSLEGLANAVYLGAGHRETVTANVPNLVIRAFTIPRDAILTERSIVGVSAKEHATDISDITHGNRLAAFSNDIAVSIVLPESLILDLYRRSVRHSILTLHTLKYSATEIVNALSLRNIAVSKSGVNKVTRENAAEEAGRPKPPSKATNSGKAKVRTAALVKKVKKATTGPNPQTQSQIALELGVSQATIQRVISEELEGKVRKKYRVHGLSDAMIQQRLARGPRFLNWISGRKWENVLTIDEAWVYLTNCKGRRKIYYEFRGERTEESWTKFWKESHPKGVMFVAGVCNRGKTKIRFIEPGAKINSKYYIEKVLTPMFRDDVPAASLDGIRGQYLVLRENALLQISPSNTHDHDYDLALPRIASWVIGASFEGPPIVNLPDPITFTAKVDRYDSEKNHTCVFWNISAANGRGTWESHGCTLTNQTGRQLTCQCNHLTSFAILVDFYAADYHGKGGSALPKFLDDLTTAALALSISGLLFTLCAIVLVCKLSKAVPRRFLSKNEFVIINLSVALLGSYTTFLAGVDRVEPRAGCVAVGCLIHYFFLVAFCWEAVEGFLLYKAFAPATATAASVEFRHFRAKTCALAWGIPLIIVGIILITNPQYYVGPNVCWLQNQTALFVAFITPICLTLLGNLLVFVIVMKGIWKREAIRSTKAKENIVTDLRRGMSLFFILGLPWLLLMLNASHGLSGGRLALHILIVIFCGTQGFGIFAVQVFGMRKELKDLYRRRRLPQSPVHSTQPSPGNAAVVDHPSVSSPSSSPSLEAEPTDKKDS